MWRNFCRVNAKNKERTFNIIDTTWIQYSAKVLGNTLDAPSFYSIGWLDTIMKEYRNVIFDESWLMEEMTCIEKSNEFIKANSLHSHHPNEQGHFLWAQYLARQSGWNDDI